MNDRSTRDAGYRWIKLGAICGLLVWFVYAALIFGQLPEPAAVTLVCAFGPLLGIASVGLYHFIAIAGRTVTLQIAAVANVIGGTLLTTMLLVQGSLNLRMEKAIAKAADPAASESLKAVWRGVDSVQLGLDVAWDVFIALGTLLFAFNMLRHPRLGKIIGILGILLAVGLFALNVYTFPTPPGEAGLIDLGPFAGLWYLVVAIIVLRSLGWARDKLNSAM
jgi:hypothetical protein